MILQSLLNPSANVLAASSNTNLYVWGGDASGQLGDGNSIDRSAPAAVTNFIGGKSFAQVIVGASHSLALDSVGGLWAWGDNSVGQIGDGTTINRSNAVKIGNSSWIKIGTAKDSSAAIRVDNTMWAWGNNAIGQVGDGTTINKSSPVQLGGVLSVVQGDSFTAVGGAYYAGYAIRADNKTLWAWGSNFAGQLGVGDQVDRSSPTQVQLQYQSWKAIAVSGDGTLAISAINGSLWGWGPNTVGFLGDGTTVSKSSPVLVNSNSWKSVAAGASHASLLKSDGTLWVVGLNGNGQLGLGDAVSRSSFTQVGLLSNWTSVSAGGTSTFATNTSGDMYAMGDAQATAQGTNASNYSSPVRIGIWKSSWKIITSGINFSIGIRATDSSLWSWGINASGQVGDGTTIDKSIPVLIDNSKSWISVTAGSQYAAAVASNGTLWTWGSNSVGQLGQGDTINRSSPTQVGTLSNWTFVAAGMGSTFTHALNSSGQMYVIGSTQGAQVGDGSFPTNNQVSSPVRIGTKPSSWKMAATGQTAALAISGDSTLWGWGVNTYGPLGTGDTLLRSVPTQIGTSSWTFIASSISGGGGSAAGIDINGRLFVWGYNASGQVGDGTTVDKSSPVLVQTRDSSWKTISTGYFHSLAISAVDSSLWAWGTNNYGAVGDGTTIAKSSPIQIDSSQSWSQVWATYLSSMAITTTGKLYSWGYNSAGQLGQGDTIDRSSPTQVGTATSWKNLPRDGGIQSQCPAFATDTSDNLWGWGPNGVGQLGDNTTVSKSSPVSVAIGRGFSQISVGAAHAAGIFSSPANLLGLLSTWGQNTYGQLGTGTTVNRSNALSGYVLGASSYSCTWVSAGSSHTHFIDTTSKLWATGYNVIGQLGDGTTVNKSSPVGVGTSSWTKVAGGQSNAMAQRIDGTLWMWGYGVSIGDGTTVSKSSPVQVASIGAFTGDIPARTISNFETGFNFAGAVLGDGTLVMWGRNVEYELGTGDTTNRSGPGTVGYNGPATNGSWTFVTTKLNQTLAIRSDGSLWFWGQSTGGFMAYDTSVRLLPTKMLGGQSWVSAGLFDLSQNGAAVTNTGKLYTWGNNNAQGQLGIGNTLSPVSPVQVTLGAASGQSFTIVSPGYSYCHAITSTGALLAWGTQSLGQLGDGTVVAKSSPVQIGSSSWTAVNSNNYVARGITSDGRLFTWGGNNLGHLMNGLGNTSTTRSSPGQVGYPMSWTAIANGFYTPGAINQFGELYLGGRSDALTFGNGDTVSPQSVIYESIPVISPNYTQNVSFVALYSGNANVTAKDSLGQLWGWGQGSGGIGIGNGFTNGGYHIPVRTPLPAGLSATSVGAGLYFVTAVDTSNALWAVGRNNEGEMGDGTTVNKTAWQRVSSSALGISNFIATGAAYTTGYGIGTDYNIYAWGLGTSGQLGDNTAVTKSSPVKVATPAGTSFTNLGSAYYGGWGILGFAPAAPTDALTYSTYAWGLNTSYQFGEGTTLPKSSPTLTGFTPHFSEHGYSWSGQVAASSLNGSAINSTGGLYSWGSNNVGQVGDNTTVNRFSPTKIGFSSWSAVTRTISTGVAIRADQTLWGWGLNTTGQIGDNTLVNKSSPVQIASALTGASWTVVVGAPQGSSTFAIRGDTGQLYAWGVNNVGQLGDGSTVNKSSPVAVTPLVNGIPVYTTSISATVSWTSAIVSSDHLMAWGLGTSGQLGANNTTTKSSPVLVSTTLTTTSSNSKTWSKLVLASGDQPLFRLAIDTEGKIWGWGYNGYGNFGDGTTVDKSYAARVLYNSKPWANVISSEAATYAIDSIGRLYGVGSNSNGQLGDGTTVNKSSPVQIGTGTSFISVGSGYLTGFAIDNSYRLYSWGRNNFYQLGLNDTTDRSSPTQLTSGPASWVKVTAGTNTGLGIDSSANLWGWGLNAFNSVGVSPGTNHTSESIPVQSIITNVKDVAISRYDTFILTNDGKVYGTGQNASGALAVGTAGQMGPTQVSPPPSGSWTAIALTLPGAPAQAGFLIDSAGKLYSSGPSSFGQLGDSGVTRSSPVQVGTAPETYTYEYSFNMLSSGYGDFFHAISTGATSNVYSWGNNTYGQLGVLPNSPITYIQVPRKTSIDTTAYYSSASVTSTGGRYINMMATSTDGTVLLDKTSVWTLGNNNVGQLGDGTTVNKSSPTVIISANATYIVAGAAHSSTIKTDGSLWVWGKNDVGQLGDGTTINKSSPVQLGTSSWTVIDMGLSHTVGIATGNTLYTWGNNFNGQLGDGTTTNKSTPTQITSFTFLKNIYGGGNFTLKQ
jgi:alpha-tubulin suppressor-like RCC1 family protein